MPEALLANNQRPSNNEKMLWVTGDTINTRQAPAIFRNTTFKVNAIDHGYTSTDINNHSGPGSVLDAAAKLVKSAMIPANGPTCQFFSDDNVPKIGTSPWYHSSAKAYTNAATFFFLNCFLISKILNMTLEEKGPIVAPPVLNTFPQQVSKEIQGWKDITAATHWDLYDRTKPDGADFYIGQKELGHIHLDGEIHLAIGKELATVLIKNKLGKKFPWGNDWVTSPIDSEKDVAHGVWLFKLSYDRVKGKPMEKLVAEIDAYK